MIDGLLGLCDQLKQEKERKKSNKRKREREERYVGNTIEVPLEIKREDISDTVPTEKINVLPDTCIILRSTNSKPGNGNGQYSQEFKYFWDMYPRPVCKVAAWKAWKARLSQGVSPGEIMAGLIRYLAYIKALDTEEQFILHPSTFIGPSRRWEDTWKIPAGKRKKSIADIVNEAKGL